MHRRLPELDALRGLMLVWITLTHLPTVVSTYINQPLGFFAATEGFIVLSALFTGRIYFGIAKREGLRAMSRKLWMRAGKLYCCQLLLLGVAFAIGAPLAAHGNRPAVHNLLDYYFSTGRTHALLDAATMIYRPPLLDILPIYIIFLALTPFALILAARLGWKFIFGGSFTLWLLAQFGFRSFAYHAMARIFGLHIPLNEMGAFDLWAWQFWWIVGVWLGVRWANDDLPVSAWAKRMTIPAAIIGVAFLVLRYAQVAGILELGKIDVLLNKWDFGVGRIIDFAAVATLAIRFRSVLKPLAISPLVMMGQASLQVFCTHLLCVFFALVILGNNSVLSGGKSAILILISLSALLITARIATKQGIKAVADPATGPHQLEIPSSAHYESGLSTKKVA
jgi:hypothetical protein